jgi:hypothetical protein
MAPFETGEDRTVGVGEGGLADLTLQDQQLVPECKDLDVLVPIAHRQQAQKNEGTGHGKIGETQQHNRSCCLHAPRR